MRTTELARVIIILSVLFAEAAVPPLATGYLDLQAAQESMRAGAYSKGARLYTAAARLLFWRMDLWEEAGASAFAAGELDEAVRLLTAAAQRTGLSARGWDALGSAYWAMGERALAISSWQTGSAARPDDVQLLDTLAAAYHQQADYDAEEAAWVVRLRLGEDAEARYRLGILLMNSDPGSASQELAAAASDAEFEEAVATLQATMSEAAKVSDPARSRVVTGRGLALVQEWGLALREFRQAAEASPSDPEAWAWVGEAKQHVGEDGLAELDRALSLGADQSSVHVLRGLYFRRQGRDREAIYEYSVAAAFDPDNPAIQSSLGEAFAARGDLVAALSAYQRATVLAPGDATYLRLLALFCADHSVRVADVGLPAALKAARLLPNDPETLDALGWSYAQAGYLGQAREALLRAAESPPGLASARVHLAVLYLRLGDNTRALDQLRSVVKSDRTSPAAQSALQLLHTYFPSVDIAPTSREP